MTKLEKQTQVEKLQKEIEITNEKLKISREVMNTISLMVDRESKIGMLVNTIATKINY